NDLSDWEKPYPVVPKGGPEGKDMTLLADPDCFRVGDFYYAYSAAEDVRLCKSSDLVNWSYVGGLLKHEMPDVAAGEDLSCANMFQIGDKWMLLCISHFMGCRYYLGDWDAVTEQFVPESHGRMNWRSPGQSITDPVYRDFFAPESVLTPDGRRVMWAWLATLDKEIDLKSLQSLPRELSLADDGTLRINPLRELEGLRYDGEVFENLVVAPSGGAGRSGWYAQRITEIDSDSYEVRITIDRSEADRRRIGCLLYADENHAGLPVIIRPESGTICVGETEAPFAVADLPEGEGVELRIFVDKYLVEVFVNGRQAALTSYLGYKDGGRNIDAYSFRGRGDAELKLRKVEIWKLRPTNQGFMEARESRVWAPDID
ncbi:MAG: glycoside hydrolase family 32 protein, partial [Spirochaetales bacterium]|nr:glycoside hydrolase family 32 protein [Spirochaetales bacterium]